MQMFECPNCNKLNPLRGQHRHINDEIIEIGITCQHCQRWSHWGYYNPDLIAREQALTNRRRKRAFKRDYAAFQVKAEKSLATELEL